MKRWYLRVETIDGDVSYILIDSSLAQAPGFDYREGLFLLGLDIDPVEVRERFFPEYRLCDLIMKPIFLEEIEAMPEVI